MYCACPQTPPSQLSIFVTLPCVLYMRGRERERGNKSIIEVQREGDTYPTCNERPTRERDGGGSNERGRERHRIREKPRWCTMHCVKKGWPAPGLTHSVLRRIPEKNLAETWQNLPTRAARAFTHRPFELLFKPPQKPRGCALAIRLVGA